MIDLENMSDKDKIKIIKKDPEFLMELVKALKPESKKNLARAAVGYMAEAFNYKTANIMLMEKLKQYEAENKEGES
jgi:hypothetical protein